MDISCLPNEIIEIILSYNDISFEDIINFRCVCKQFHKAAKDEYCFLRKKYLQRWPIAKEHYDQHFKKNESKESKNNEKQLNFIKIGTSCAKQLQHVVYQIYHGNNDYNNVVTCYFGNSRDCSHTNLKFLNYLLEDLKEIISETDDYIILIFFMDEIKNLLTQSQGRTSCDLTKRYYYVLLYDYLRSYLWQNFDKFQEYYNKDHLLERSATIVANWLEADKNRLYSDVRKSLDSIALEVLKCLGKDNSNHSIFSTTNEMFTYWKNNNIEDNYWDETEGTQIINALEEYIFGDRFRFKFFYFSDYAYVRTCIDNILENEVRDEMSLLIIYQSVARRLGLRCEIVNLPEKGHLQLFWKPKYTDDIENIRLFEINIIDCATSGLLYDKKWIMNFQSLNLPSIVYSKIIRKQAYIVESKQVLETLQSFPDTVQRFVDHHYILNELKRLACKSRPQEVKFAVGMIVNVKHRNCSDLGGVIIGWHQYSSKCDCEYDYEYDSECDYEYDSECDDCFISKSIDCEALVELEFWNYFQNDIPHHTHIQTTLYIILHHTSLISYVKEDDITLTTPKLIEECEIDIGHYFCKFEKTHYVPNKILEKIYPQDAAIAARTVFKN